MGGWTQAQAVTVQALEENGGNVNRAMSQVYRNNIARHDKSELLHRYRMGGVDDDSTTQPPPVTNAKKLKWQKPDTVQTRVRVIRGCLSSSDPHSYTNSTVGSNKNASVGAIGYGPPRSARKVNGPNSSHLPVVTPQAASMLIRMSGACI
jgi:hypothetical protein